MPCLLWGSPLRSPLLPRRRPGLLPALVLALLPPALHPALAQDPAPAGVPAPTGRRAAQQAPAQVPGQTPGQVAGQGAPAAPTPRDESVLLRLDERQVRAVGIETAGVASESAATELTLPGIVAVPPHQLRVVAAPAGGLIESMAVAPDESVAEGQPIARLRSTELVEAQRLFLTALSADGLARNRLERDEQLYKERIIAERRVITTRAEAVFARTELDERRQLLGLLGMPEAAVERLRRDRQIAPALEVVAPVGGIVLQRQATPGERVAAAAPLFTVANLSPLWINLQVPQSGIASLEPGARVILPNSGAQGRILRLGRSVDQGTQSIAAVAEMTENIQNLRPGQAVNARVVLGVGTSAQWLVPAGAVVRHRGRSWVFVQVPEGFRAKPVGVLSETAQSTSLRGPLTPRDQVAVRGVLSLLAELSEADQG